MTDIPDTLKKMMKRAGIDFSEMKSDLDELDYYLTDLHNEIGIIQNEIELDENEGTRSGDWHIRAKRALQIKRAQYNVVKRYKQFLQKNSKSAVENVRAEMARAIESRDKRIRNLHFCFQRERLIRHALRKWVFDNFPERIVEIDDITLSLEEKFSQKDNLGEEK